MTHDPADSDKHWAEAASYGVAAAIRAAQSQSLPPLPYLNDLLEQAEGSGQTFTEALAMVDDPLTQTYLRRFLGMSPADVTGDHFTAPRGYLPSVWQTFVKRTARFLQPGVLRMLGGSDFRARDLLERRTTLYLMWPEKDLEVLAAPLNLILTGLLSALATETDEREAKRRVLFALDEAGRVKLPNLPEYCSTLAGRGVILAVYVQALEQLWDTYGHYGGETVLANCNHKVFFPGRSLKTNEYISRSLGTLSHLEKRLSRRRGVGQPETVSRGFVSRPLLTSDQVWMLPRDKTVIFSDN